jgi:hypothetical protein
VFRITIRLTILPVADSEVVEGPLREYYPVGFLDTDDADQWETEIGWPIFRCDS